MIRNPGDNLDEIREYRNARYVGSNEATWRILEFPIHENFPSVLVLPIHLPNCQQIIYDPNCPFDLNNAPWSKLIDLFRLCTEDVFASSLFYYQVTHWYAWNKKWQRRLRGGKNAQLGRISQISPKAGELFYLRLLLIYSRVLHSCSFGYGHNGQRPVLGESHGRCRTLAYCKQIEATFRVPYYLSRVTLML